MQTKNLENPKEEQKRIEQKKVVAQAEALSAEEMDKFAREIMGGFERSVALLQSQLREGFETLTTLDETIKIKEAWIEDLYAIQSNADSLSTLILAQKKQKEEAQLELAEAEAELESLRQLSESLDTRMQEVEPRAIKATEERLEREHRFKFDLAQKETEGQLRLKDQQIELLQQKIKEIETQLREAGLKVSTSEETVRDIALRAIDSSAMTSRALSREPRPSSVREGTDEA